MAEQKAGAISYDTLRKLKERGLTTHFLAFVAVFGENESAAQSNISRYLEWSEQQPVVPLYKKQPTQRQWIEKFRQHAPDFLKL